MLVCQIVLYGTTYHVVFHIKIKKKTENAICQKKILQIIQILTQKYVYMQMYVCSQVLFEIFTMNFRGMEYISMTYEILGRTTHK